MIAPRVLFTTTLLGDDYRIVLANVVEGYPGNLKVEWKDLDAMGNVCWKDVGSLWPFIEENHRGMADEITAEHVLAHCVIKCADAISEAARGC